ncbi:MAP kinase kinase kinase kinase activity protein [Marasmius sp. AFHP31]|nr:MAP kinase kinase kinase kinase activity protein [Marasmius sp. AFHP31]
MSTTLSPQYSVCSPPSDAPQGHLRERCVEDSRSATESSQMISGTPTAAGEYCEMSQAATEADCSSTSKMPATTSGPLPRFPFSETDEANGTELHPPVLCRRRPIPPQYGTDVALHRLLMSPREAGLHWDLLWSHQSVENELEGRWKVLKDPATFLALPSMTVVHHWLPWPITVHTSGLDSRGVTVVDVLITISKELLQPVVEERSRIRIDFLRGHRIFLGLKPSRLGGDVWDLIVG